MPTPNLAKLDINGLEIRGYSVAGEETVIMAPYFNVCFDIGRCPEHALNMDHVLLSHGHMDHAAGIAYYFSQRDFREMQPGSALMPEKLVGPINELLDCWGRIDGNRPPANIIPMKPGQEYELRRNLFAFAFATNHAGGALGYTIIERRQKLKSEYFGLAGQEIAKLRQNGEEVTYTLNLPMITFLGDTMGGEFENLACVKHSQIILVECTFFDPDHHDRADAGRHYHIDRLAQVLPTWENETIVLTHLSRRTDLREAKKILKQKLPPEVLDKIVFLMDRGRHKKNRTSESAV